MITEAQRRALFALREALRLCEEAKVEVYQGIGCVGFGAADFKWSGLSESENLHASDIDGLLVEYPEQ